MLLRMLPLLQLLIAAFCAFAQNWTANPFIPPAIPLAVKTPYLQTWVQTARVNSSLNYWWPSYRDGSKVAWAGLLKIDNDQVFVWMGPLLSRNAGIQKEMIITPTRTIITMTCGSIDMTITFLTPIEPTDLVNQSIPFSYLAVEVASNDGSPHRVQLYTDIDGTWLAGNEQLIQWNNTVGDSIIHQYSLQNQAGFGELNGKPTYGSIVYSTKQASGLTYQVASSLSVTWPAFENNGTLNNTVDSKFRAVQDDWPVFAFAHDLGIVVTTKASPVVYTVGYVRDPLVQFLNVQNVNRLRAPYYLTRYSSIPDMVTTFLRDYPNALARAVDFDNALALNASALTGQDDNYAGILALSVRQMFGNIELTVGWDGTSLAPNDIMAFLNDGFTNAVDVIYSAWPAFLYTNPLIGKYLLEPLLAYQVANPVQDGYAIHDLGALLYLNVTGPSSETYPVEACGDQLIMALSYTQKTSDNSLITKYQGLYDQFGTYLAQNGLYMTSQLSSGNYAGPLANQTNLAVKSIVALKAASEIFQILGDNDRSRHYDNIAASFLEQWKKVSVSLDGSHYTLSYGNDQSWGLLYNLYADELLDFNMFPSSVYDTQSQWYATKLGQFGIQMDSRSSDARTDWQLWTAATVTDKALRSTMISLVKKYVSSGINIGPFPERYNSENGQAYALMDRSVVGGHFAPLLFPDVKQRNNNDSSSSGNNNGHKSGVVATVPWTYPVALTSFVMLIYTLA